MIALRNPTIRLRMTLWWTALVCLSLGAFAAIFLTWQHHQHQLIAQRWIEQDYVLAAVALKEDAGGAVVWDSEQRPRGRLVISAADGTVLLAVPQRTIPGELRQSLRPMRVGTHDVQVSSELAMDWFKDEIAEIGLGLGLSALAVVAVSAALAWLLTGRVLRPIRLLAARAEEISARNLATRLHVPNPRDELGQLADTFNRTFARLERSFDELERFTADASHELRTALTALRTIAEAGLHREDPLQAQEALVSVVEELRRLGQLVENLLLLARSDRGVSTLQRTTCDAHELAASAVSLVRELADERGHPLQCDFATPGALPLLIDADLVRRALLNLLVNALRHTPPGTPIEVSAKRRGAVAAIRVRDHGPGIPPEDMEHLFKRFHRADRARTRSTEGGFGLGLAIARWAVELNGGRLEVTSTPGQGAEFVVLLPIALDPGVTPPTLPAMRER